MLLKQFGSFLSTNNGVAPPNYSNLSETDTPTKDYAHYHSTNNNPNNNNNNTNNNNSTKKADSTTGNPKKRKHFTPDEDDKIKQVLNNYLFGFALFDIL